MATRNIEDSASLGTVTDGDSIYIISGTQDITTNVDQSGLTNGLTFVNVAPRFTASFGTVTTPFKADVDQSTAIFRWQGSGQCWYQPAGNSNVCSTLRVLNGTMQLVGGGTVTKGEVMAGRLVAAEAVTITTLNQGGGDIRLEGTAGTGPTTLNITGGQFYTRRGATTVTIYGGDVTIDASSNTITTLNIAGGNVSLRNSGTITTLNLIDGDASKIVVARAITITNTNIWSTVRNGSAFLHSRLLTFTNAATWIGDDGTIAR